MGIDFTIREEADARQTGVNPDLHLNWGAMSLLSDLLREQDVLDDEAEGPAPVSATLDYEDHDRAYGESLMRCGEVSLVDSLRQHLARYRDFLTVGLFREQDRST